MASGYKLYIYIVYTMADANPLREHCVVEKHDPRPMRDMITWKRGIGKSGVRLGEKTLKLLAKYVWRCVNPVSINYAGPKQTNQRQRKVYTRDEREAWLNEPIYKSVLLFMSDGQCDHNRNINVEPL